MAQRYTITLQGEGDLEAVRKAFDELIPKLDAAAGSDGLPPSGSLHGAIDELQGFNVSAHDLRSDPGRATVIAPDPDDPEPDEAP